MTRTYTSPARWRQFFVAVNFFVLLLFISPFSNLLFGQTATFTTSGSWTCPAGVTSVTVQAWGAGGGGSNVSGRNRPGGGGGAYASSTLSVSAISSPYNLIVGSGGTPGNNGGNSSFNGSGVVAAGGSGTTSTTAGGAGGTVAASTGTIRYPGGSGGTATNGNNDAGAGGGGSAYFNLNGSNGGNNVSNIPGAGGAGTGTGGTGGLNNANGNNGNAPGGGGGGKGDGTTNSGTGASGQVLLTYTCPVYSLTSVSSVSVCIGNSSVITLDGNPANLPIGTYNVTYNLVGAVNAIGLTASMAVSTAGTGSFTIGPLSNSGSTTITITNLSSGVSAPSSGCNSVISSNNTSTIIINPLPQGNLSSNGSFCVSGSGTLTWTATAGTGPFTIVYNDGVANRTVSNVTSGVAFPVFTTPVTSTTTYSLVSVTGQYCQRTSGFTQGSASITINPLPTIALSAAASAVCSGTTSSSLSYSATSNSPNTYSISWNASPANSFVPVTDAALPASPITISVPVGTNPGTYTGNLTVKNANGCISTVSTFTVDVIALPADPLNPTSNSPQCSDVGVTLTRNGTPPGGETWFWQTSSNGTSTVNSGSTYNVTSSGTYYLRSRNNTTLCWSSGAGSLAVTVNPLPANPGNPTSNSPQCADVGVNLTRSNPSAGETWYWQTSAAGTSTANSGSTYNVSSSGTYYLRAQNNTTLCWSSGAGSLAVTVNPIPAVTTSSTAAACSGVAPGIGLTATVASNFSWTIGTINGGITGASSSSGNTINQVLNNPSNTVSGSIVYNVTPTSTTGSCVGASYPITLTINPQPVITNSTAASICSGTGPNISLVASAASNFAWTIGTISGSISGASASSGNTINQPLTNPSNAASGSVQYLVTPTSTTGSCVGNATTITVTVTPTPAVTTASTKSICSGADVNLVLTASTGSSFSWTVGAITGGISGASAGSGSTISQVLSNSSNTTPGTVQYIITPTATVNGCVGNPSTITVTVNPIPALSSASTAATCSGVGPGIGLTASAASTYTWTVGAITGGITGASASSGNTINQVLTNPSNAASGTVVYNVIPTSTAGSCVGSNFPITLTVHPTPVLTNSTAASICSGTGSNIGLTASTASNFAWTIGTITGGITGASASTGNSINQTLINSSNSTSGSVQYLVTPTATTGSCVGTTSTVTVTVTPTPAVTTAATKTICSGTDIGLSLTASTGSNFTWTIGTITGGITGTSAGSGSAINQILTNPGNATAGTAQYIVTPTATVNGCIGSSYTITATVNPIPVVSTPPPSQNICTGNTANINFSGSVSGTSFTWTRDNPSGITGSGGLSAFSGTGNISGTLSNSASTPGTVSFNATPTANGCTGSTVNNITTITVLPVATVNAISNQTFCHNTASTAINFSGTGTSYTWTNSNTSIGLGASGTGNISSFTASNAGSSPISGNVTVTPVYTVAGTNCNGTSSGFSITINPIPVLTSSLTANTCSGAIFNYSPTSSATGVTVSYNWSRAVVAGISNAAAGGTGNVNETLVNTTGSNINVTYVYTLSGFNNISCVNPASYNVVVTVKPTPTVAMTANGALSVCQGVSNNFAGVSLSNPNSLAGTTLTWTSSNTAQITGLAASGTGNIPAATLTNTSGSIQYSTLTGTATFNGCSSSTTLTLQVNPPISNNVLIAPIEVDICSLSKQVTFNTSNAQGGDGTYSYLWEYSETGNNDWVVIPGQTGATLVHTYPQVQAFFRRTAYSDGCAANSSGNFQVNKPTTNGITQTTVNTTYCSGGNGATISLDASIPSATYTLQYEVSNNNWQPAAGFSTITGNGSGISFSNITTAGKYRIFANISGGCSQTYSEVTIVVNNLPNTPVASGTNTICAGASANIVGTLAGFSINWYTTASGGTALNASPVASGAAYAVTPSVTTKFYAEAVNNSTSCRSIGRDSVTITVRQLPVVNTATQSICSGSVPSLALSASNSPNGFTWQASANGNVGGLSTNTFTTSTINNNGVALTNNTNTSQTITYTVSANTTGPTCTGPSTTLVTVVVDPRPTVNSKTATICSANAFTVTPTNGVAGDIIPSSPITQYTWSAPSGAGFTGGTSASNASNISGTLTNTTNSATTATYTVTPIAGSCSGTAFTTTVTINPRPFVTTQNVAVCSGNTFTVTPANGGGNIVPASTTYAWPVPTGSNISGIAPGTGLSSISGTITNTSSPAVPVTATYTVTPTGPSGLGSCVGNDFTLVATINPLPTATISGTTAACLNAASPNITFTGANGTAPYTFTYNINGGANQTANSVGNSITVSVPTGTAGVYNYNLVSVRDASATLCTQVQTGTATITVNPLPTATISGTTAVCLNAASPNITFTGANGTAPYTFTYNINGGANQTANSVGNSITVSVPTGTAGVYNYNLVSVRDASATLCTQVQSGTATITVNPLPTANISGTTVVCLNAASPNITFTGANGTAPYTFTYNINGGANQTANSVGNSITVSVPTGTPGVYNYNLVSVRDASATLCTQVQSGTATITVNPLPTATISGTTAVCLNAASPNITFTGANGTAPYTFTYNINGGANQTANSVGNSITVSVPTGTAGVYNYNLVSVRDASATLCTQVQSGTATVTVNPLPTANISGTTAVCLNAASPNITFTGANGTAPYTFTYNINGGANLTATSAGNSITVSVPTGTAGVYNYNLLSVRDASATLCTQVQTGTATITVNPLPTATISGTTAVCLNAASPSITFTGANGTAPYTFTYNINGGANQTANSVGNSITVSVPTGTAGVYNYNLISVIDASSSACSQNQAGTATVTVNTAITGTLSGDATICAGGSATLTIAIPAGAGNYFGTINPGGIAFSGTAPAIPVIVSPGATSSYSIASISGTCVNASGTATVTIPNGTPGLWTCAAGNSDWFDCRNWANGMVPDNLTNVTISTPVGCNPVIDPNSPNAPADKIARSANMLIGGSANLSFAGAGNLYVAGNWNNTVGPSGFTAGTSTVTLMGSTGAGCTQTITTAGSNETFYNLVINNICNRDGAGLGDNVTLNSPVNVTGVLTLTDGIVKTSATNILTVTNPAVTAIAGGGAASYINGPIARLTNSTGTYIFPTGNPDGATLYGVYRPATIIPGSGSANSYTGAYLPTAAPEVNNQQLGTTGILTTEYWDIKPSGACTGTAVIGLPYVYPASASHWTAGMAPCSSCNVAIARPAPTAWYFTDFNNFVGTGFNGSIPEDRFYSNSGMIYTKPIDCNGFQTPHFTFGFNFATVLPVGLVSFEGKFLNNNDARLVWEVANSNEIRRFMLEHSSDGNRFSLVSDIPAGSVNTYQYDHKSLSPGLHYYRLQLTDKRGEKTYSKTLLLVNGKQVTVIRNIVPNPVTQSGYVNLLSAGRQQARIVIYDLAGRLIGERRYDLTEGENRLEVAAGKLAQGIYNLQVITGDGVSKNLRMIKE